MNGLSIVIIGLSITSSWGNGHATTYRSLVRALARRGHDVLFLERDVPWYANSRDLPRPPYGRTRLYQDLPQLERKFSAAVARADLTIVGSYVPEGVRVGRWVIETARKGLTAFYDIDTPVTVAKLDRGDEEYLSADLVPLYDLYLSFTGGPLLARLAREYGARQPLPFYCSVDPEMYFPEPAAGRRWDLGYLGTYSADRQSALERLMLAVAEGLPERRFAVAGPQYPNDIAWPRNVARIEHLAPGDHRRFYNAQRFTLNLTRREMVRAGWSPSVRLFEAAASGTPIISDWWEGLDRLFRPGRDILIARDTADVARFLRDLPEERRRAIGHAGRQRVLSAHTSMHRAAELERYVGATAPRRPARAAAPSANRGATPARTHPMTIVAHKA